MGILGFEIKSGAAAGDFTPIVKYDARSGRVFRVDRVNTGNGFVSDQVDITATFKAVMDLENVQTGWIAFPPGAPPSFVLVPLSLDPANQMPIPAKPSDKHDSGVRITMKLSKACGGEKQIREIAGTAKSFLSGIEELYADFMRERVKYAGQLPVVTLASTLPVKSGSGTMSSTNYRPKWRIDGWAPRPVDLVPTQVPLTGAPVEPLPMTAPATGATVVPPNVMKGVPAPQMADDDFG